MTGLAMERDHFTRLLSQLHAQVQTERDRSDSPFHGLLFVLDESRVLSPRKVKRLGMVFTAYDAVHGDSGRFVSLHHEGCAADHLFYAFDDKELKWLPVAGTHPAYRRMADIWRSLDARATPGWDFGDPGHVSLTRGGRR